MSEISLPIDLGDGLVLRRASLADLDAIAAFNASIHADEEFESPMIAASTADLFGQRLPHPTTTPADFTIVEDTATGVIASSLCLIPQTWSYDGVTISTALVEFVGTNADYRNRGLVRRQFDVIHQWCSERAILVQGIAGIPGYYRQFGYEYALQYGPHRIAERARLPKLSGDEPVRIRRAEVSDAPFIAALEEGNRDRWLVTSVRDERVWRYEIAERDSGSSDYVHVFIIEQPDGTPIGYLTYSLYPNDVPWVEAFDLVRTASWLETIPTVLRHLLTVYDGQDVESPTEKYAEFELGGDHPVYEAMPRVLSSVSKPYALYLRVGDIPTFLRAIAPSLESRMERSVAIGYTGEFAISCYRSGVRLVFHAGRIVDINTERLDEDVDVSLPESAFVQLLFGYRSLAELYAWHADLRLRNNTAQVLAEALFPKRASYLRPLG